jgi:hypothetical protein
MNLMSSLYCEECKRDIPVETLENGTIIIHCPRCIGECMACDCALAVKCFADEPKVKVLHLADDKGTGS